MKDIKRIANMAKEILDRLEIPYEKEIEYKINYRSTTCLGRCSWRYGRCTIEISDVLMHDSIDDKHALNTMIHELIHSGTVGDHHQGMWKVYANKVTKETGIKIERLADEYESRLINAKRKPIKYKYKAECPLCGNSVYRQRNSDLIKNINSYRCGRCHEGKFIIYNLY